MIFAIASSVFLMLVLATTTPIERLAMEHKLQGSCLCNTVQYEAMGDLLGFYHCHCSRCRKASGTGHASNILLKPGKLNWLEGEDKVSIYKVPEASRFASWFCSNCGSSLPRFSEEYNLAVVPAGTLDEDPDIEPQCRIFWDSKASWSCADNDLEVFSEYPEKRS